MMADVHDKKTRSYNMSRIKGKDTTPELIVRKFLHSHGFRYRLNDKKLTGKPDIVLPKYKTIIDVRGCFWHSHKDCKNGKNNTTPSKTITTKRETAIHRDGIKMEKWKEQGWDVIVVWADCQLQPKRKYSEIRQETLEAIITKLRNAYTNN